MSGNILKSFAGSWTAAGPTMLDFLAVYGEISAAQMALEIRLAREEDAAEIARVSDAAFAPLRAIYRPNPTAIVNVSNLAPQLHRLVALQNGAIVASVRFGVIEASLRVIGLGVDPLTQRQGVAKQLLEHLAEIAREKRCDRLSLYTIVETGNVAVFNRLGFVVVRQQPDEFCISMTGQTLTEAYMERLVANTK